MHDFRRLADTGEDMLPLEKYEENGHDHNDRLEQLGDRIISRVNTNLSELEFDTESFVYATLEHEKMLKFYAFYGFTSHHPIDFDFQDSNLAGTYFLGKCNVKRSIVYKSDIRGDELKRKGDNIDCAKNVPMLDDEVIAIRNSLLYKTLVHSHSHNPESPEEFTIQNTISAHYANIHGSTINGSFLGAFATVDLMNLHSCVIGEFSYVQVGELFHKEVKPGTVWVKAPGIELKYRFDKDILNDYVGVNESHQPRGKIYDFVQQREEAYERLFDVVNLTPVETPESSSVNRYAVIKGKTTIGKNVLVSQRAFLENANMGDGANAQENSYIIDSTLRGMNVTAHGGKIIHSDIGVKTFVGFNSFLYGKEDAKIRVGQGCVVMPHTIIDSAEPIEIPDYHLVWGFIGSPSDLEHQSISFDSLEKVRGKIEIGKMEFNGNGLAFISANKARINHILSDNGAFYHKGNQRGHAQDGQHISFNILQPYRAGENKGMYPTISIKP